MKTRSLKSNSFYGRNKPKRKKNQELTSSLFFPPKSNVFTLTKNHAQLSSLQFAFTKNHAVAAQKEQSICCEPQREKG
jgi:hypothetical protein